MEESYREDGTTYKFPVINLVTAGGSDGLLLPLHQVLGDPYPENPNFFPMEEPHENSSVTCKMRIIILVLICLRVSICSSYSVQRAIPFLRTVVPP